MELRKQIAVVRAWFLLLVVGVVLSGAVAYFVSSGLPKIYEARARLIVGQALTSANPDYNQLLVSQRLSATYAAVATTRPLLERVIQSLKLPMTPATLAGAVNVDAPDNTALITVAVSDADPKRAAAIANAVASEMVASSPALQGRQGDVKLFVEGDLDVTQRQIEDVRTEVDRLSALPTRSDAEEVRLETLQSRLVTLRSSYANLLVYASDSSASSLTVVETAIPPEGPTSPRILVNTALAALVGLLVALAIAFLAEYLDDTVKSGEDIRELLDLPTLGAITQMHSPKGQSDIYRMVTVLYPRSPITEAFRSLRTMVEFASVDTPVRTLLVTSSFAGEGKTTVAANLAVVEAQGGKRVLLMDADLRKPGVHKILDLPNSEGLSTLLLQEDPDIESVVQETEIPNLRVLTTGGLPQNPAELLGSRRFRHLLDRLSHGYDIVIVDSPPVLAVTDATVLSSLVTGTLFVVRAGRTRRATIRAGREALAKAGANVLGVTLNQLSRRNASQAYYYYYQSYDGYGHGNDAPRPAAVEK